MVAMRVWVKCMKSKAKSRVPAVHSRVRPNSCLSRWYSTGSISTPNSAPMNRQPKGFIPKIRMPKEMMSLPRVGWVFS